jgi:hypothetical protein
MMEERLTFRQWSQGICLLSSYVPNRLSLPQASFFALAALCDRAGRPGYIKELREALGDRGGRSVQNSYRVFLAPTEDRRDGLGWLRHGYANDGRKRLVRLTPKGRAVMEKVLAAAGVSN